MPNTRSLCAPSLEPQQSCLGARGEAGALTVALASAALAFFSRALQASRSRRRFCRSRLSFCRVDHSNSETSPDLARDPWETWTQKWTVILGHSAYRSHLWRGPGSLPGMTTCAQSSEEWFQTPHRNRFPVPFQEVAQGSEEAEGGSVDEVPLCCSQTLLSF